MKAYYRIKVEGAFGNYDVGVITPEKLDESQVIQHIKDNHLVNTGDIHNIYSIDELTEKEYNEEF